MRTSRRAFSQQVIKADTQDLKADVHDLKAKIKDLHVDTQVLMGKTQDLKAETQDLKADTQDLKADGVLDETEVSDSKKKVVLTVLTKATVPIYIVKS